MASTRQLTFTPPKTLGDCVDKLGQLDTEITKLNAKATILKDEYNLLVKHMLELLKKQKSTSAAGKAFECKSDIILLPTVKDWDAYRKYIVRTNSWELLQKRPGVKAWRERLDQKVLVPGSEVYQQVVLSLKKKKAKR